MQLSARDDLVSKIMRFIAGYKETAKPFVWTYAKEPVEAAS